MQDCHANVWRGLAATCNVGELQDRRHWKHPSFHTGVTDRQDRQDTAEDKSKLDECLGVLLGVCPEVRVRRLRHGTCLLVCSTEGAGLPSGPDAIAVASRQSPALTPFFSTTPLFLAPRAPSVSLPLVSCLISSSPPPFLQLLQSRHSASLLSLSTPFALLVRQSPTAGHVPCVVVWPCLYRPPWLRSRLPSHLNFWLPCSLVVESLLLPSIGQALDFIACWVAYRCTSTTSLSTVHCAASESSNVSIDDASDIRHCTRTPNLNSDNPAATVHWHTSLPFSPPLSLNRSHPHHRPHLLESCFPCSRRLLTALITHTWSFSPSLPCGAILPIVKMSRPRAQSSFTLPRNFTFHYTDANPPRTPEPIEMGEPLQPPEPPRPQTYRLRRRRELRQLSSDYFRPRNPRDVPVPTIEVSGSPPYEEQLYHIPQTESQLTAFGQLTRPRGSPPKTPSAQIFDTAIVQEVVSNQWESAEVCSQGESISRPSTACSGFSDSSISSSLESFPSLGGSLTSPESDIFDFKAPTELSEQLQLPMLSSPLKAYGKAPSKPSHLRTTQTWTEQMDAHLWMTYMRYLQDPTHTPFKMLPGTAPPLGVCSRIVREAKRTWKGSRSSGAIRAYRFMPWAKPTGPTLQTP